MLGYRHQVAKKEAKGQRSKGTKQKNPSALSLWPSVPLALKLPASSGMMEKGRFELLCKCANIESLTEREKRK